jgi:ATP-binding cassette subfamily C protein
MEVFLSDLRRFIGDLLKTDRKTLLRGIMLSTAHGLAGAASLVLVVPLLSVAGLSPTGDGFLSRLENLAQSVPQTLRLIAVLAAYAGIILVQAFLGRASRIMEYRLSGEYALSLRTRFFDAAVDSEWEYILSRRKSDLSNALLTDIDRIVFTAQAIIRIVSQCIVATVHLGIALAISPLVTVSLVLAGACFFFATNQTNIEGRKLGISLIALNRQLHADLVEKLGSLKEMKMYGAEGEQKSEFRQHCSSLKDNVVEISEVQSRPELIYKSGAAALISLFLFLGIEVAELSVSALILQVFIFAKLWPFFSGFQTGIQQISTMLPSFASFMTQVAEFQKCKETMSSLPEADIEISSHIELRGVSFGYKGSKTLALEGIDIRIEARTMTALVGPSGSGKSTLVDILSGLFLCQSGSMYVDDREIEEKDRLAWRRSIGYVPQDPFIFGGTVRENLVRFNPQIDEAKIISSLRKASADFVFSLPKGLDTLVGDRGVKLSGGERQRIVLARALARDPRFLILDEATSALDNENEYRIQKALADLAGKLTILVVAHRLSTVRRASQVIVLDKGRVAEMGTFEDLSNNKDGVLTRLLEYGDLA